MLTERRQHTRFKATHGAFAASGNTTSRIGPIQDISKGGLAFHYVDTGRQDEEAQKIDIFLDGNRFYLKEVPVRAVNDVLLAKDLPFSSVPMRKMSVEFGQLNTSQRLALENFLLNHTAGQA